MFAIVSDIHGNLEAFTAVLGEIERRGIQQIVCLGDIVGYGPNPKECLDLVKDRCRAAIMGNHDFALFYEPFNFNAGAEQACYWSRAQFEAEADVERRAARWKFLGNLPVRVKTPEFVAVHASPRRPINEYIFPDDIYTNPASSARFSSGSTSSASWATRTCPACSWRGRTSTAPTSWTTALR